MKKLLLTLLILLICAACFAQDNPYAVFGYKSKVQYKTNADDIYRIKNANPNSMVKYIEFDRDNKSVVLLNAKDSILQKITLTDDELLRWVAVDPKADKYPSMSPYNYANNDPIKNIDPDGKGPYPVVTVTDEVVGTAQQRVLGYSNSPENPAKYSTTTVNVYKVVVTDTEDPNFHMEFGATRDAFTVTKANYASAYVANGNGDGPRTASNVAFEPPGGQPGTYDAQQKQGGYPNGAASAMYLTTPDGSTTLPSASRPAAVAAGYSTSPTSADGVMFHVGGFYTNSSGGTSLAGSEACFGVVNPGNSSSSPSNGYTNNVIGTIFDQAAKSKTNPGLVQVVIQPRTDEQKSKTVGP
jgi:hypothetical protein